MPISTARLSNPLNQVFVNPTDNKYAAQLTPLFSDPSRTYFIPHYSQIPIADPVSKEDIEITLSHALFRLDKPERESKKSPGKIKPACTKYVVFDPKGIGEGTYGAVFDVTGKWELNGTSWIYKKATKAQVVKTNSCYLPSDSDQRYQLTHDDVITTYKDEFEIAKKVTHMGTKYDPTFFNDFAFLLMNKIPGISLQKIIKEANTKPTFISIQDRLIITINLLKKLQEQVHDVKEVDSNPEREDTLAHRDIKPDNILVDKTDVNYIDYGLAAFINSGTKEIGGTPLYIDPLIFNRILTRENEITDLASLGRVIAELWGDTSKDALMNPAQLQNYNRTVVLRDLLANLLPNPNEPEQIDKLTAIEAHKLKEVITKLTRPDLKSRISREDALKVFEELLAQRVVYDEKINKLNATTRDIADLSANELLHVLKSQNAVYLLGRFGKYPEKIAMIYNKLGYRLLELSDETLEALKAFKLDFIQFSLSADAIHHHSLSPTAIRRLIQLGATLEPDCFKQWLKRPCDNDEARWVAICRSLYSCSPHARDELHQASDIPDFNAEFCQKFLRKPETVETESTNIQLIKHHLIIEQLQFDLMSDIKIKLHNFAPDSNLEKALLSATLLKPNAEKLLLAQPIEHEKVLDALTRLDKLQLTNAKYYIHTQFTNNCRQATLLKIIAKIEAIKTLDNMNWETALLGTRVLEAELRKVEQLDEVYKNLAGWAHYSELPALKQVIDGMHALPTAKVESLSTRVQTTTIYIEAIKTLRKALLTHENNAEELAELSHKFDISLKSVDLNCTQILLSDTAFIYDKYLKILSDKVFDTFDKRIAATTNNCAKRIAFLKRMKVLFMSETNSLSYSALHKNLDKLDLFLLNEHVIKLKFDKHPKSYNLIYGLLNKKLGKTDPKKVLNLLSIKTVQQALLGEHVLNLIERAITLIDTQTNPLTYASQINELEKLVWIHLNESPSHAIASIDNFIKRLGAAKQTYNPSFYPAEGAPLSPEGLVNANSY